MASIMKFVGGGVTIDFIADTAYRVTQWNPAVATRRAGEIGGRGPYNEVVEEMTLFIGGATALAKLQALQLLLEQAVVWSKGGTASSILFHYKATASSSELKTVILGPPAPGEPMIELPPNFSLAVNTQAIEPVIVRFKRLGWWLGADDSNNSSSVAHPTTATIANFTDVNADSPVILKLNSIANADHAKNSFLLMASEVNTAGAANYIQIINAEILTTTNWTSVSDTANKARNSNVLRYTPTLTTVSNGIQGAITTTSANRWAIFVNYRNNSAGTSFKIRGGINSNLFTPFYVVPAGFSTPKWVYLGTVETPGSQLAEYVFLSAQASAASGSIDFDSIALLAMDKNGQAIAIQDGGGESAVSSSTVVDHRLLSYPSPLVYHNTAAAALNYTGNAILTIRPDDTAIAAAWLACGTGSEAAYWVPTNGSGVAYNTTFTAVQSVAYLIPE
jgi:hypothetical protein